MAKPKVVKVDCQFKLKDLFYAEKLVSGTRVCLLLPLKNSKRRNRRWKFVRGTLYMEYKVYCECCGAMFYAYLVKADGTKMVLANDLKGNAVLPH